MPRFVIASLLSFLVVAHAAGAQTATTARIVQTSVLVQAPRGDSPVITTLPPGVVVEVLARTGDWYQARLLNGTQRLGWVHRTVVELLPSGGGATVPVVGGSEAQALILPAAAEPTPSSEPLLARGTTEMIVAANLAGWNAGGDTVGVFQVEGLVGFVASSHLEVVVSTSLLKASGVDASGSLGGGLFLNFRQDGVVIPFAGGVVGRGFGTSDLLGGLVDDAKFVNVSGGFRVMTRGGGGALIIRPFYERDFNSSDLIPVADLNRFGVSLGVSILF